MRIAIAQSVIAAALAGAVKPEPVIAVIPPGLAPLPPKKHTHLDAHTPKAWPAIRVTASGTVYLVGKDGGWRRLGLFRPEDADLDTRIRELMDVSDRGTAK